jgi:WD40 repeat protein
MDAQFDSTGSRVVTSGRDNDARVWSVTNGKLIHTLRAHFGAVATASFSNDGRWIATAGPTTVGLWRARTGRFLGFVRGPSSTVTGASFSPKGHTIVASSVDGSVRVYNCEICGDLNQLVALGKRRVADAHGRRPT